MRAFAKYIRLVIKILMFLAFNQEVTMGWLGGKERLAARNLRVTVSLSLFYIVCECYISCQSLHLIVLFFFLEVTHGVYLERWDRIDYKRVKFLLKDPRYPNLPSFAKCVPRFQQPSEWADFFGSRLRTYFVPFQTGNHYFFLCKMLQFLQFFT